MKRLLILITIFYYITIFGITIDFYNDINYTNTVDTLITGNPIYYKLDSIKKNIYYDLYIYGNEYIDIKSNIISNSNTYQNYIGNYDVSDTILQFILLREPLYYNPSTIDVYDTISLDSTIREIKYIIKNRQNKNYNYNIGNNSRFLLRNENEIIFNSEYVTEDNSWIFQDSIYKKKISDYLIEDKLYTLVFETKFNDNINDYQITINNSIGINTGKYPDDLPVSIEIDRVDESYNYVSSPQKIGFYIKDSLNNKINSFDTELTSWYCKLEIEEITENNNDNIQTKYEKLLDNITRVDEKYYIDIPDDMNLSNGKYTLTLMLISNGDNVNIPGIAKLILKDSRIINVYYTDRIYLKSLPEIYYKRNSISVYPYENRYLNQGMTAKFTFSLSDTEQIAIGYIDKTESYLQIENIILDINSYSIYDTGEINIITGNKTILTSDTIIYPLLYIKGKDILGNVFSCTISITDTINILPNITMDYIPGTFKLNNCSESSIISYETYVFSLDLNANSLIGCTITENSYLKFNLSNQSFSIPVESSKKDIYGDTTVRLTFEDYYINTSKSGLIFPNLLLTIKDDKNYSYYSRLNIDELMYIYKIDIDEIYINNITPTQILSNDTISFKTVIYNNNKTSVNIDTFNITLANQDTEIIPSRSLPVIIESGDTRIIESNNYLCIDTTGYYNLGYECILSKPGNIIKNIDTDIFDTIIIFQEPDITYTINSCTPTYNLLDNKLYNTSFNISNNSNMLVYIDSVTVYVYNNDNLIYIHDNENIPIANNSTKQLDYQIKDKIVDEGIYSVYINIDGFDKDGYQYKYKFYGDTLYFYNKPVPYFEYIYPGNDTIYNDSRLNTLCRIILSNTSDYIKIELNNLSFYTDTDLINSNIYFSNIDYNLIHNDNKLLFKFDSVVIDINDTLDIYLYIKNSEIQTGNITLTFEKEGLLITEKTFGSEISIIDYNAVTETNIFTIKNNNIIKINNFHLLESNNIFTNSETVSLLQIDIKNNYNSDVYLDTIGLVLYNSSNDTILPNTIFDELYYTISTGTNTYNVNDTSIYLDFNNQKISDGTVLTIFISGILQTNSILNQGIFFSIEKTDDLTVEDYNGNIIPLNNKFPLYSSSFDIIPSNNANIGFNIFSDTAVVNNKTNLLLDFNISLSSQLINSYTIFDTMILQVKDYNGIETNPYYFIDKILLYNEDKRIADYDVLSQDTSIIINTDYYLTPYDTTTIKVYGIINKKSDTDYFKITIESANNIIISSAGNNIECTGTYPSEYKYIIFSDSIQYLNISDTENFDNDILKFSVGQRLYYQLSQIDSSNIYYIKVINSNNDTIYSIELSGETGTVLSYYDLPDTYEIGDWQIIFFDSTVILDTVAFFVVYVPNYSYTLQSSDEIIENNSNYFDIILKIKNLKNQSMNRFLKQIQLKYYNDSYDTVFDISTISSAVKIYVNNTLLYTKDLENNSYETKFEFSGNEEIKYSSSIQIKFRYLLNSDISELKQLLFVIEKSKIQYVSNSGNILTYNDTDLFFDTLYYYPENDVILSIVSMNDRIYNNISDQNIIKFEFNNMNEHISLYLKEFSFKVYDINDNLLEPYTVFENVKLLKNDQIKKIVYPENTTDKITVTFNNSELLIDNNQKTNIQFKIKTENGFTEPFKIKIEYYNIKISDTYTNNITNISRSFPIESQLIYQTEYPLFETQLESKLEPIVYNTNNSDEINLFKIHINNLKDTKTNFIINNMKFRIINSYEEELFLNDIFDTIYVYDNNLLLQEIQVPDNDTNVITLTDTSNVITCILSNTLNYYINASLKQNIYGKKYKIGIKQGDITIQDNINGNVLYSNDALFTDYQNINKLSGVEISLDYDTSITIVSNSDTNLLATILVKNTDDLQTDYLQIKKIGLNSTELLKNWCEKIFIVNSHDEILAEFTPNTTDYSIIFSLDEHSVSNNSYETYSIYYNTKFIDDISEKSFIINFDSGILLDNCSFDTYYYIASNEIHIKSKNIIDIDIIIKNNTEFVIPDNNKMVHYNTIYCKNKSDSDIFLDKLEISYPVNYYNRVLSYQFDTIVIYNNGEYYDQFSEITATEFNIIDTPISLYNNDTVTLDIWVYHQKKLFSNYFTQLMIYNKNNIGFSEITEINYVNRFPLSSKTIYYDTFPAFYIGQLKINNYNEYLIGDTKSALGSFTIYPEKQKYPDNISILNELVIYGFNEYKNSIELKSIISKLYIYLDKNLLDANTTISDNKILINFCDSYVLANNDTHTMDIYFDIYDTMNNNIKINFEFKNTFLSFKDTNGIDFINNTNTDFYTNQFNIKYIPDIHIEYDKIIDVLGISENNYIGDYILTNQKYFSISPKLDYLEFNLFINDTFAYPYNVIEKICLLYDDRYSFSYEPSYNDTNIRIDFNENIFLSTMYPQKFKVYMTLKPNVSKNDNLILYQESDNIGLLHNTKKLVNVVDTDFIIGTYVIKDLKENYNVSDTEKIFYSNSDFFISDEIYVTGNNIQPFQSLLIQLLDNDSNILASKIKYSSATGSFSELLYKFTDQDEPGRYIITIEDSNTRDLKSRFYINLFIPVSITLDIIFDTSFYTAPIQSGLFKYNITNNNMYNIQIKNIVFSLMLNDEKPISDLIENILVKDKNNFIDISNYEFEDTYINLYVNKTINSYETETLKVYFSFPYISGVINYGDYISVTVYDTQTQLLISGTNKYYNVSPLSRSNYFKKYVYRLPEVDINIHKIKDYIFAYQKKQDILKLTFNDRSDTPFEDYQLNNIKIKISNADSVTEQLLNNSFYLYNKNSTNQVMGIFDTPYLVFNTEYFYNKFQSGSNYTFYISTIFDTDINIDNEINFLIHTDNQNFYDITNFNNTFQVNKDISSNYIDSEIIITKKPAIHFNYIPSNNEIIYQDNNQILIGYLTINQMNSECNYQVAYLKSLNFYLTDNNYHNQDFNSFIKQLKIYNSKSKLIYTKTFIESLKTLTVSFTEPIVIDNNNSETLAIYITAKTDINDSGPFKIILNNQTDTDIIAVDFSNNEVSVQGVYSDSPLLSQLLYFINPPLIEIEEYRFYNSGNIIYYTNKYYNIAKYKFKNNGTTDYINKKPNVYFNGINYTAKLNDNFVDLNTIIDTVLIVKDGTDSIYANISDNIIMSNDTIIISYDESMEILIRIMFNDNNVSLLDNINFDIIDANDILFYDTLYKNSVEIVDFDLYNFNIELNMYREPDIKIDFFQNNQTRKILNNSYKEILGSFKIEYISSEPAHDMYFKNIHVRFKDCNNNDTYINDYIPKLYLLDSDYNIIKEVNIGNDYYINFSLLYNNIIVSPETEYTYYIAGDIFNSYSGSRYFKLGFDYDTDVTFRYYQNGYNNYYPNNTVNKYSDTVLIINIPEMSLEIDYNSEDYVTIGQNDIDLFTLDFSNIIENTSILITQIKLLFRESNSDTLISNYIDKISIYESGLKVYSATDFDSDYVYLSIPYYAGVIEYDNNRNYNVKFDLQDDTSLVNKDIQFIIPDIYSIDAYDSNFLNFLPVNYSYPITSYSIKIRNKSKLIYNKIDNFYDTLPVGSKHRKVMKILLSNSYYQYSSKIKITDIRLYIYDSENNFKNPTIYFDDISFKINGTYYSGTISENDITFTFDNVQLESGDTYSIDVYTDVKNNAPYYDKIKFVLPNDNSIIAENMYTDDYIEIVNINFPDSTNIIQFYPPEPEILLYNDSSFTNNSCDFDTESIIYINIYNLESNNEYRLNIMNDYTETQFVFNTDFEGNYYYSYSVPDTYKFDTYWIYISDKNYDTIILNNSFYIHHIPTVNITYIQNNNLLTESQTKLNLFSISLNYYSTDTNTVINIKNLIFDYFTDIGNRISPNIINDKIYVYDVNNNDTIISRIISSSETQVILNLDYTLPPNDTVVFTVFGDIRESIETLSNIVLSFDTANSVLRKFYSNDIVDIGYINQYRYNFSIIHKTKMNISYQDLSPTTFKRDQTLTSILKMMITNGADSPSNTLLVNNIMMNLYSNSNSYINNLFFDTVYLSNSIDTEIIVLDDDTSVIYFNNTSFLPDYIENNASSTFFLSTSIKSDAVVDIKFKFGLYVYKDILVYDTGFNRQINTANILDIFTKSMEIIVPYSGEGYAYITPNVFFGKSGRGPFTLYYHSGNHGIESYYPEDGLITITLPEGFSMPQQTDEDTSNYIKIEYINSLPGRTPVMLDSFTISVPLSQMDANTDVLKIYFGQDYLSAFDFPDTVDTYTINIGSVTNINADIKYIDTYPTVFITEPDTVYTYGRYGSPYAGLLMYYGVNTLKNDSPIYGYRIKYRILSQPNSDGYFSENSYSNGYVYIGGLNNVYTDTGIENNVLTNKYGAGYFTVRTSEVSGTTIITNLNFDDTITIVTNTNNVSYRLKLYPGFEIEPDNNYIDVVVINENQLFEEIAAEQDIYFHIILNKNAVSNYTNESSAIIPAGSSRTTLRIYDSTEELVFAMPYIDSGMISNVSGDYLFFQDNFDTINTKQKFETGKKIAYSNNLIIPVKNKTDDTIYYIQKGSDTIAKLNSFKNKNEVVDGPNLIEDNIYPYSYTTVNKNNFYLSVYNNNKISIKNILNGTFLFEEYNMVLDPFSNDTYIIVSADSTIFFYNTINEDSIAIINGQQCYNPQLSEDNNLFTFIYNNNLYGIYNFQETLYSIRNGIILPITDPDNNSSVEKILNYTVIDYIHIYNKITGDSNIICITDMNNIFDNDSFRHGQFNNYDDVQPQMINYNIRYNRYNTVIPDITNYLWIGFDVNTTEFYLVNKTYIYNMYKYFYYKTINVGSDSYDISVYNNAVLEIQQGTFNAEKEINIMSNLSSNILPLENQIINYFLYDSYLVVFNITPEVIVPATPYRLKFLLDNYHYNKFNDSNSTEYINNLRFFKYDYTAMGWYPVDTFIDTEEKLISTYIYTPGQYGLFIENKNRIELKYNNRNVFYYGLEDSITISKYNSLNKIDESWDDTIIITCPGCTVVPETNYISNGTDTVNMELFFDTPGKYMLNIQSISYDYLYYDTEIYLQEKNTPYFEIEIIQDTIVIYDSITINCIAYDTFGRLMYDYQDTIILSYGDINNRVISDTFICGRISVDNIVFFNKGYNNIAVVSASNESMNGTRDIVVYKEPFDHFEIYINDTIAVNQLFAMTVIAYGQSGHIIADYNNDVFFITDSDTLFYSANTNRFNKGILTQLNYIEGFPDGHYTNIYITDKSATSVKTVFIADSTPPFIDTAYVIDYTRYYKNYDTIFIRLIGETSSKTFFTIPGVVYDSGMLDNGDSVDYNDSFANDGVYNGLYYINNCRNVNDTIIEISMIDRFGNLSSIRLKNDTVTIDTVPPVITRAALYGINKVDNYFLETDTELQMVIEFMERNIDTIALNYTNITNLNLSDASKTFYDTGMMLTLPISQYNIRKFNKAVYSINLYDLAGYRTYDTFTVIKNNFLSVLSDTENTNYFAAEDSSTVLKFLPGTFIEPVIITITDKVDRDIKETADDKLSMMNYIKNIDNDNDSLRNIILYDYKTNKLLTRNDYLKPVELGIKYMDNITNAQQNALSILYLDETSVQWTIPDIPESNLNLSDFSQDYIDKKYVRVDGENRILYVNVEHLSIYKIFQFVNTNLDNIYVYPNPFIPNITNISNDNKIKFIGLPDNVEIIIFDILGREVKRIQGDFNIDWDITNNNGNPVASGLYIFIVRDKDTNKTFTGKVSIIK